LLLLSPLLFFFPSDSRLPRSPNEAHSDAHFLSSTPLFASDQPILRAAAAGATEHRAENAKKMESNKQASKTGSSALPARRGFNVSLSTL
jgi:hypothetical protein